MIATTRAMRGGSRPVLRAPTHATTAAVVETAPPDGMHHTVVGAIGCPARAPSMEAFALGWRLRADGLLLAAALAGASADPAQRADAMRLRRAAQAWSSGARRLLDCTPRRLSWLQGHLSMSAATGDGGPAFAAMASSLAVWRLARLMRGSSHQAGGTA